MNYKEMKKVNYMLEIDILKNSSEFLGCPEGFGCPNDTQMPCWLRHCAAGYLSGQQPDEKVIDERLY